VTTTLGKRLMDLKYLKKLGMVNIFNMFAGFAN